MRSASSRGLKCMQKHGVMVAIRWLQSDAQDVWVQRLYMDDLRACDICCNVCAGDHGRFSMFSAETFLLLGLPPKIWRLSIAIWHTRHPASRKFLTRKNAPPLSGSPR